MRVEKIMGQIVSKSYKSLPGRNNKHIISIGCQFYTADPVFDLVLPSSRAYHGSLVSLDISSIIGNSSLVEDIKFCTISASNNFYIPALPAYTPYGELVLAMDNSQVVTKSFTNTQLQTSFTDFNFGIPVRLNQLSTINLLLSNMNAYFVASSVVLNFFDFEMPAYYIG